MWRCSVFLPPGWVVWCSILFGLLLAFSTIALRGGWGDPIRASAEKLVPNPFCLSVSEISEAECTALDVLYYSTDGPNWTNSDGWLSTTTPCSWYGVECSAAVSASSYSSHLGTRQVISITLSSNQLAGEIPAEFYNLPFLLNLRLDDNSLSGELLPNVENLVAVQVIDLNTNQLTGTIPSTLGNLANLQDLSLGFNQLHGSIPAQLGSISTLRYLSLRDNQLTGTIPSELGSLNNLEYLILSNNVLIGTIPLELTTLSKLTWLELNGNRLGGSIPPETGNLKQLEYLRLHTNWFTGAVPADIGQMSNLHHLYLGANQLTGTIPSELGALTALLDLDLALNQLSGEMPVEISNLANLENLDIGYNRLVTTNSSLDTFLTSKDPDWKATQTVPPTNLHALSQTTNVISLGWTSIDYIGDGGHYEIGVSAASSGPYTVHGTTADKTVASYTVDGLTPATTYYLRIRTLTPMHAGPNKEAWATDDDQQNELWSAYSTVISATTASGSATPTPTGTVTPIPTPTATATLLPEDGNSCSSAHTASFGVKQNGIFESKGDQDWLRFNGRAGQTYIIEVTNLGADSDAIISLFDVCSESPRQVEFPNLGGKVRLQWDSIQESVYYIELRQYDPSFFGPQATYDVVIFEDKVAPSPPQNFSCSAAGDTTITAQWRESRESDVRQYVINYSAVDGSHSGNLELDGAASTVLTWNEAKAGVVYSFVIFAIDFSANRSQASLPIQCRGGRPPDNTKPTLTVKLPTAAAIYTTTAETLSFTGFVEDQGGNLSRVGVHNQANSKEGWDYGLLGKSDTFRVDDLGLAPLENRIAITAYDAAGNSATKQITVVRIENRPGAVIIVAGRNEVSGLQPNIHNSTNLAYRVFRNAGYGEDDIYYLAPAHQNIDDDDLPETDALVSPVAVQQAITDWATTKVGPNAPLFVYLADHGFTDLFCVNGCSGSGSITPRDLNSWLSQLENATGANHVNVIIEACQSGSFLDRHNGDIANSLSKAGRVIITSTGRLNNAYASRQGAFYSDVFFSCLADSNNLFSCHAQATSALPLFLKQTPWLDDNGDGVADVGDGTIATQRTIMPSFGQGSSGRPRIIRTEVERRGSSGTLSATVEEGAGEIDLVWVAVFRPSFQEPDNVTLNLNVPTLVLEDLDEDGVYTAEYPNGFMEEGTYNTIFYAQDKEGLHAMPQTPTSDGRVLLPLIIR